MNGRAEVDIRFAMLKLCVIEMQLLEWCLFAGCTDFASLADNVSLHGGRTVDRPWGNFLVVTKVSYNKGPEYFLAWECKCRVSQSALSPKHCGT